MTLEQLSLIGDVISAFAVVASLIFVGVQLRHATDAVRASSSQAHADMYHTVIASLINDDDGFADIWSRGLTDLDSLDDDEIVRFFAMLSSLFRFFESSRVQWRRDQLDEEHWHTIEQQAISLSVQPGIKSFWQVRRHWHCQQFRDWFESLPADKARPIYNRALKSAPNRRRKPTSA